MIWRLSEMKFTNLQMSSRDLNWKIGYPYSDSCNGPQGNMAYSCTSFHENAIHLKTTGMYYLHNSMLLYIKKNDNGD